MEKLALQTTARGIGSRMSCIPAHQLPDLGCRAQSGVGEYLGYWGRQLHPVQTTFKRPSGASRDSVQCSTPSRPLASPLRRYCKGARLVGFEGLAQHPRAERATERGREKAGNYGRMTCCEAAPSSHRPSQTAPCINMPLRILRRHCARLADCPKLQGAPYHG